LPELQRVPVPEFRDSNVYELNVEIFIKDEQERNLTLIAL
jgi:hypothetical protein